MQVNAIIHTTSQLQVEQLVALAQQHPYFVPARIAQYATKAINNKLCNLYTTHAYLNSVAIQQFNNNTKLSKLDTLMQGLAPVSDSNSQEAILPLHTQDYFLAQQIQSSDDEVEHFVTEQKAKHNIEEANADNQQVLITRSFTEWLQYYKIKKQKEEQENKEKTALRAIWQKEKLTAAIEEENDVVPEAVFNLAINSISLSQDTASESLAKIMETQGKYDKAIEMYRKLSLTNTEKSAYFATRIKEIKHKQEQQA
jgi:tetratricopeptide (TPR) repeat protein